ncbi:MAG: M23 family metallopeptidase [Saprospiraceae bacterium]|nr:M23 family metallopeptidase [Lewinellaceae bacterium]
MQKYFGIIQKIRDLVRSQKDDSRGLLEKMRDQYRLVIMNDETFEEVSSLKLTPLRVYIFLSSLVVGTAILITALIVYTPLKRYIPGYGNFQRDTEIAELTSKVAGLEEEIKAHRAYNENFRKILVGDMADLTEEAVKKNSQPASADAKESNNSPKKVDRIDEDEALRVAVADGTFSGGGESAANVLNPIIAREKPLEQHVFMPPVSGEVMSPFDLHKNHYGLDVAAPKNTAVKAAADGVVISAGYTVETGYSIAIQHPNDVITMYKHNSVLLKKAGSAVKAGEAIAIIGNSGENTSGPHLHFELWHKGRAVNPSDYINFN